MVTGASAGVGRATAVEFARRGARLGLIARGEAGLAAAGRDVEQAGGAVVTALADVADPAAVEAAAERIERELGPIDVWVNNAMTSVFARVWDVSPDEFRRVMDVNFFGYTNGTQTALRRMRPRDRGVVVQVGSALAFRGIPLQSAYCASKHAIQGFHESLESELQAERSSVRVTMVHMPALNTPQFEWVRTRLPHHPQPVPPIYQPEVAARAIVWAAVRAPREITVGLPTWATRFANKVAPGLVTRYLARTGIDSQQTDEPVDLSQWRDNVFEPLDDSEDFGAHGRYDDRARPRSVHSWANRHRAVVLGVGAAGVAGGALLRRR